MNAREDYLLVVDDKLNGFKDAFIDERLKEITVSPAIFSLLQDSDCREAVLEQISFYNLNFFPEAERSGSFEKTGHQLNTRGLGRW